MAEKCPGFSLLVDDAQDDAVTWAGESRFFNKNGECLQSLRIRVVCPKDYPKRLPYVIDVKGTLTPEMCGGHMFKPDRLCYGTRLDERLNDRNLSVANVVECVDYFVANLWCFENTREWPHGHFHQYAFLDHEINKESIKKDAPCPCGVSSLTYRECHHKLHRRWLAEKEGLRKSRALISVSPNEPCRCNSGKKYKQCCALKHKRENYSRSPLFMLLKYPEINPQLAEGIWRHFANDPGEFGQLVRKSPIGLFLAK